MAKIEKVKIEAKKLYYEVTELGKGLHVGCEEGNITLNNEAPQKALKYVYDNVVGGNRYIKIVSK